MLNKKAIYFVVFLVGAVGFSAFSQATRSPFTAIGIGDVIDPNLAHNQGNGLGISNGTYWNLNNVNPALLPYASLTNFSAGFVGTQGTTSDGSTNEDFSSGNLNYLVTAFPIVSGRWTSSVGLMPFSNVDYDFAYTGSVNGSDDVAEIRETGTGGINQFYWSNGVALNEQIFVGLKATYMFSGVEKEFSNFILGVGNVDIPVVNDRINVSDFSFTGGLAYNLDSIFNSSVKVKLGLTYDFAANLNAERFQTFDRFDVFRGANNIIDSDTLINNVKGSIRLPEGFGFGLSFNEGIKWMVGVDVQMRQWSDYRDFDGANDDLDDSFKVTLGGEYTIDPTSVTSYFKRITFRLGGSFEETPLLVENNGEFNQVRDFGINFGWSLPVSKLSSVDMGFRVGRRGNATETILEENYYRVYLGITFNDRWFIKRRYD